MYNYSVSNFIHKSDYVSVLLYHIVLPSEYRRVVFGDYVVNALTEIRVEINPEWLELKEDL